VCGIVGYVGHRDAAPLLLDGLLRLEYRGYDSAGLATVHDGQLLVQKAAGRIADLQDRLGDTVPPGAIGLAHTRWATHGAPNDRNAHPHTDCTGSLAVVHNGVIENASVLRGLLEQQGHTFRSDTDTEILAHLIEEVLDGSLSDAVGAAVQQIDGAYGIAVLSVSEPEMLVAARRGSPLVLGLGTDEHLIASDVAAVLEHTRDVVYLDDDEIAVVRADSYEILDRDNSQIEKLVSTIDWDLETIERGGYAHFMLKEIMEQPESIRNALRGRLIEREGTAKLDGLNIPDRQLRHVDRIVLTGCGTSWHAALIGEYMLEELVRLPVEVEYASEFRYRDPVLTERTLVIGISQSGETADTLAALREAKARGARTLGIVNAVGSTIAREVDGGIYLHAGPEIGVASTKAFTCQVVALALLTLRLGRLRELSQRQGQAFIRALEQLPDQVSDVLARSSEIEQIAAAFMRAQNALYLGRGYNFPVALEGALKLKEISYIHAEGYPAAEMKHGPIALIDDMMPVICIAPRGNVYQKILSNVEEVKARRGHVLAVVTEGDERITELSDYHIPIPETMAPLTPVLSVLPLQLFAYYAAVRRGCDVDRPRNLAKSVTVE
jgi:glucosamine--fructose-6-phosphate aminotransferase (isomerizing)